ncbi:MAG: Ldh family oxidoreductase [Spirochaetales bacterium]|jgi:LDH2 family malate/lactate/ureidoglycolate dehydrogenase|nr:Ldh family oxidoreductase [Spirochaetales bacterium]
MGKIIKKESAVSFIARVMEAAGMPPDDALLWAGLMTETSLLGFDTHGIRMVERYVDFLTQGGATVEKPRIIKADGAITQIDARGCMGHLAAWKAVQTAAENAKKYGISFTSVKNSGHIGACSLYSKALAEKDCIGFCCTASRPGIAPTGGVKPTVGINPLSVSAPINAESFFLLDMSTTITAMGKVTQALDNGKQIPPGWALDKNGKPTTDPREARDGSLLPIGGYKGYGLALAIELLCSALSGGSFSDEISSWITQPRNPTKIPFAVIAVDIGHFQEPGHFKQTLQTWLAKVIDVPRQEGVGRIYFPGEIENEKYSLRGREGIPLEDVTVESFQRLARKYSIAEADILTCV